MLRYTFDPIVITKKGPEAFQRDLCWTLAQKQALVDSIYEHISLGAVLVRSRSYADVERLVDAGYSEVAFREVIDGKQRISTIVEFLNDGFTDSSGNKFSDLSDLAQHEFLNHQLLAYVEIGEKATDDYVIKQFLKANFTGVPQSKEHIDYVREIHSHF